MELATRFEDVVLLGVGLLIGVGGATLTSAAGEALVRIVGSPL